MKDMITIKVNNQLTKREETLDGVAHVVYPVIMINEGVHKRVLYVNAEITKSTQYWNGVPVPVYHPKDDNGNPISCNSPDVYNTQVIGKVFNAHMDESALKAELYINKDKTNNLTPGLLTFLDNEGQMDVSTGLFSDDIYQSGVFENEEYDAIAVNIRPDHLAILPGIDGACSWADGCGIRANEKNKAKEKFMAKNKNDPKINQEEFVKGEIDQFIILPENPEDFKVNEADFDTISNLVYRKLDSMDIRDEKYHYPLKIYTDRVIYRVRYRDSGTGPKLMQRNYTITENEDAINWITDPVEVVRNETFTPKTNEKENDMAKIKTMKDCCPDQVTSFIKQNSAFEGKEDVLMGMTEDQFKVLMLGKTEDVVDGDDKDNKDDKIKANEDSPKVLSFDELLAHADEETREYMTRGKRHMKEQKEKLVTVIKANEDNSFTEQELDGFDMDMLEKLAALANVKVDPVHEYGMQVPITTHSATGNDVPPLPDPSFDLQETK